MTWPKPGSPFPVVERTTRLEFPVEIVYRWHTRAGAFERLMPPWERVALLERSGGIEDGARSVLRVRIGPRGDRWSALHRAQVPGRRFVDEQVEGPLAHWIHTHSFDPDGESACWLTDRVEYAPPYRLPGVAAALGLRLLRRRVERLLAYRHALLAQDLAAHSRFADRGSLRIAITGASGMIGRGLTAFLTTGGHTVLRLVRRAAGAGEISWDPAAGEIDVGALEGCDAVVHLAGENVGAGRWTEARRRRIRESRQRGTALIAETIARLDRQPRVLVSATAIGIYGSRGDEVLTEQSAPAPPGTFLADICREWEGATEPARLAGVQVALPRFGVVLSPAGGALGKMLPIFRAGVGGPIGSGRQWMSCVSIEDVISAIHHALFTDALRGPFNVVGPTPVTNAEFAATLGRVLQRPAILPVPAIALRLVLGEMADETVLASVRVLPDRLLASSYQFRHPTLESALRFELGRFAGL
jgi:uncharacterized protein (TIGR01777 family)